MLDESTLPGCTGIEGLILQALVRKLLEKGLLSRDDVQSMLCDAVARLEVFGDEEVSHAVSGAGDQG